MNGINNAIMKARVIRVCVWSFLIAREKIIKAYAWSSLGVIFASTGPSVFMLMGAGMTKELCVMYFFFLGGLSVLLLGYASVKFDKNAQKEHKNTQKEQWIQLLNPQIGIRVLLGGLLFAAHFIFFISAMQAQSITETIIFVRISPLLVVILSVLILKEREGEAKSWPKIILATVLCFSGIVVLKKVDTFSLEGLLTPFSLLALAAAFSFAFFRVATIDIMDKSKRRFKKELEKSYIIGFTMIVGGIALLIWIIMTGQPLFLPALREFLFLVYLGVATVALGAFTNLKAVDLIKKQSRVAFVEYFQAIIGPIFAYLINKEVGFDYQVLAIGILLITGGVILSDRAIEKQT